MTKSSSYRIAIAGLGTVGTGLIRLLQDNGDLIAARAGRTIEIAAVNARDRNKARDMDLSGYIWTEDPSAWADDPDIDCVIELIGGSEGPARTLVEKALAAGKDVITANKALLAHHGAELAKLAEGSGASLNYEAAVAGGIPIIKAIREGFAGNRINTVCGILNGTCNYILTEMRETGRGFEDVLREAQEKGYAEADPSFDIDGIDAAHKLVLLKALAFGVLPDFKALDITGIRNIGADDILFAEELGFRIKLLGIARRLNNGKIVQALEPCLVPADSELAAVDGVFNAVYVEGDCIDKAMLEGRGAGAGPTASAVAADIVDLARGIRLPVFGVPVQDLARAQWAEVADIAGRYYLHCRVIDRPGVIADLSAVLRDQDISIESFVQRGRDPDQPVSVLIVTHETSKEAVAAAVEVISRLGSVLEIPGILRIENI